MEPEIISYLQPKFCSRAALLNAQKKIKENPSMDCRLVMQFDDGSLVPMPTKRADIVTLIDQQLVSIEADINDILDTNTDTNSND